jgi:hypothetical protein
MDFDAQRILARLHGAGGHQLPAERCQAQARGETQENRGREEENGGETVVTFWYESGSADPYLPPLTDSDPTLDPAIFVSDPQDGN